MILFCMNEPIWEANFMCQLDRAMGCLDIWSSWEIDGETVETVSDFIFFWAPKSLQMVIAAINLKDIYSLEGKL